MQKIILKGPEGHPIEVDAKAAQKSNLLKKELELSNNKENLTIDLKDIKYDILKKVVEYLEYYKNKVPKEVPKPTPSESLNSFLNDWDFNFINNLCLDETFELMNAASELKIKSLLDLASTKVASILKNRGIEDIRSMFKSGCDLSPCELKKYEELQL